MANLEHFTQEEIPYEILSKFGLTQEMSDDLPQNVMQRLLSSRTTPLLPIRTENIEGLMVECQARIYLVRLEDGSVDVGFAPQWVDADMSAFTQEQQDKLKLGEVTIADLEDKGSCYIQFDEAINQVMAVPTSIINQNIYIFTRTFALKDKDKKALEDGEIVEMNINNHILSVGIDLNDMTGIRIADGDKIAWQQDAAVDNLPRYSFGLFGCWQADDANRLSYIAEEDYTPELLEEQQRTQSMHAAEAQLRQLKV